jgi:3' terminal RNA ribose 2'-O-methyltransferase Hen1
MLLTITAEGRDAGKLSYLLAKHPDKCQRFELNHGAAYVFYPNVGEEQCEVALLLELDPVGLVRGRGEAPTIAHYVNDRPYAASSFLSVAIAQVFGSAMAGRCSQFPELPEQTFRLGARLSALRCRGGASVAERVFAPLGYTVALTEHALDDAFPEWGKSSVVSLELTGEQRVRDLLSHLYVLLPVLDNAKHYYVGRDELEKLLAKGEGWLSGHPQRELIVDRYLKHWRHLTREALERLTADDELDVEEKLETNALEEQSLEQKLSLNDIRIAAVMSALRAADVSSVVDLGCGEGRLLRELKAAREFTRILGMDVSLRALEVAEERLRLKEGSERDRERLTLIQGSLIYRDARLKDFDAACLVEVIEHLELDRMPLLERTVFEFARPATVVVTTPNAEYNVQFASLPAGRFRHRDHRFEWSRSEFESWGRDVSARHGYEVRFLPVGPVHDCVGAPTQMAIFSRVHQDTVQRASGET